MSNHTVLQELYKNTVAQSIVVSHLCWRDATQP